MPAFMRNPFRRDISFEYSTRNGGAAWRVNWVGMFQPRSVITLAVCILLVAPGLQAAPLQDQIYTYAVVLTEKPVGRRLPRPSKVPVVRARADVPVMRALAQTVEAAQQPVRAAIEDSGLVVTGSARYLLHALFVEATPEQAAKLRALNGVRHVVRMARYRRLLNAAADLINAPAAWNALGGIPNAGAGIRIAVIDSGIDNANPAFQDASLTPPA